MCVSKCTQKIARSLGRRDFLKSLGVVAATATGGTLLGPQLSRAQDEEDAEATPTPEATSTPAPAPTLGFFSRVVDLTHTLTPDFPTFSGDPQLEMEQLLNFADDGYNIYQWVLNEHTGTHLDAPFHFSEQATADMIPVTDLIGPLAVVDIRAKAEEDPDAQLTPEDIMAWEETYGPLPTGAIVAMLSGWDEFVTGEQFRNADEDGVMHFPGFHVETSEFLLEEREIKGIFVDTLSLDYGPSEDFAVHYSWLPANKWGMECVANLGMLPPIGATVFVGAPKIAGASGGPSRVIALV